MRKAQLSALVLAVSLLSSVCLADHPDHPLVKRYPGSVAADQIVSNFADVNFVKGFDAKGKAVTVLVQGKQTETYYRGPKDKSATEVFYNYSGALKRAGFETLHDTPAGKDLVFSRKYSILGIEKQMKLGGTRGIGTSLKFYSGKKKGTFVQVLVGENRQFGALAYLNIIEEKEMQDNQVGINADYLAEQLDQYGSVSVYGIQFDFDSDKVKPDSKPVLDEIAKLLQARPKLKLYVVGHTDMQGELTYNLDLSKRRAQAAVAKLVSDYRIQATRLSGYGMGPLSPKATNRNEEGRKQNRRVELIEIP